MWWVEEEVYISVSRLAQYSSGHLNSLDVMAIT